MRVLFAVVLACFCSIAGVVLADDAKPSTPAPAMLSDLAKIMNDPAMRDWIGQQAKASDAGAGNDKMRMDVQAMGMDTRSRFHALSAAMPHVPGAMKSVMDRVFADVRASGLPAPGFILAGIVMLALCGEWLSRRLLPASAGAEHPVIARTVSEVVPLGVFALIASLIFLSVTWPPAMDSVIFFYLLAAVAYRLISGLHAMAFAAGSLTAHMYLRTRVFAAVLAFGVATVAIARSFQVDTDVRAVIGMFFSVVLLAIAVETVWHNPENQTKRLKTLKSIGLILLWLVWVFGFHLIFWAMIYAVTLPPVIRAVDRMTHAFVSTRWRDHSEANIPSIIVVRGVRALVFGLAVAWLAVIWQINPTALGMSNTMFGAIFVGLLKSVVVVLVADLGWNLAAAFISRKLASVEGADGQRPDEAARRARIRTLLPIFRNGLAAVVLVITLLTVLAELGVEIAPLIAGAGVFGVAIGFGAQTLVKDIISGVFYLMDDAFRVGEYIQSGSYMGTVESFSLRSVRLRHHRGPIFTVPFGELGAVQNMSRDWVIDKFRLKVNFDADVAKAKKLTKLIGAELLADEEFGPLLIETLKMKGVEQIGDFGVELSFAFTALPGHQSVIRRRAYTLIRQSFSDNGIGFAQPTVQVGGDDKNDAAAALAAHRQRAADEAAHAQSKT